MACWGSLTFLDATKSSNIEPPKAIVPTTVVSQVLTALIAIHGTFSVRGHRGFNDLDSALWIRDLLAPASPLDAYRQHVTGSASLCLVPPRGLNSLRDDSRYVQYPSPIYEPEIERPQQCTCFLRYISCCAGWPKKHLVTVSF